MAKPAILLLAAGAAALLFAGKKKSKPSTAPAGGISWPAVNGHLLSLGYTVGTDLTAPPPKNEVGRFQAEWNNVYKAMKLGELKALPGIIERGTLFLDGIVDAKTLSAISIIIGYLKDGNMSNWTEVVAASHKVLG